MHATKFEFEQRFFIIGAIYAVGFFLSAFDPIGATTELRHLLAPSLSPGSATATNFNRAVMTGGALLVFLSAMLRTWASAYLRTDVVHDTAQHSEALVADGPFRHVRNPLYLANIPMAAGLGVLASRLGWVFIVAASWLFVYRLIFREEAALRESQGQSYLAYCQAVPRFWPALTPRVPAGNRAPHWGQAFAGESFIWLFGVAELTLALTLNMQFMFIIFTLAFGAHFLVIPWVSKRLRS
jgi:protein-S-isoprenylcysteine O-methyltransferase Ste14